MEFREFLKENIVVLDGGTGTILQRHGLQAGQKPEEWNITHPEILQKLHRDYFDAGSNVVCTNTFGANLIKYSQEKLQEVVLSAVENAKIARNQSVGTQQKYIALDIGPTGKLLTPYGDLEFEKAVEIFATTIKLGVSAGVDLVMIETMSDSLETKAALLAVKENCDLPVIVSNAYGENGRLMTGASPSVMVTMASSMGADVVGANCSFGPTALMKVADEILAVSNLPTSFKPNAGLPKVENGVTFYDIDVCQFVEEVQKALQKGVRVVGGCCGTTPEYIRELVEKLKGMQPVVLQNNAQKRFCSRTKCLEYNDNVVIGDAFNAQNNSEVMRALGEGDVDYFIDECFDMVDDEVDVITLNFSASEKEEEMLCAVAKELQTVIDVPLQIETKNAIALEKTLREYNGVAIVVTDEESKESLLPVVKKYGAVLVMEN